MNEMKYPLYWQQKSWLMWLLMPLSWIFRFSMFVRKKYWSSRSYKANCPVIVVGNISVGGTGKTPMVIATAKALQQAGKIVGVVSRGYGGRLSSKTPYLVQAEDSPNDYGDEPVIIAQTVPVVICKVRVEAVRFLEKLGVDVIVSDDGLQHYAMHRDFEIAMVDGLRGLGNGACLPAGPLREIPSRLKSCNRVVTTQIKTGEFANEYLMKLQGNTAVNLLSGEKKSLIDFASEGKVNAIAGIGNPERFFLHLKEHGLNCDCKAYPDHYRFSLEDINKGNVVLMTVKDSVKCKQLIKNNALEGCWEVPVFAELPADFYPKVFAEIYKQD